MHGLLRSVLESRVIFYTPQQERLNDSGEAVQIKDILTVLDPDDPHTVCDALRAIHHRTLWLDSIIVRCPIEHAEYGTQKRAIQ